MNVSNARAIKTFKGYIGEYRPVWRSDYLPVLIRDSKGRALGPEYFPTEEKAECAAWRALNDAMQPTMTSSGHKMTSAKLEAEKIFKGGGKVIPVERVNRRIA